MLLSACVVAGGAALTACSDGTDGSKNNKPIDEAAWKVICEEVDYTNFSFRSDNGFEVLISENAVYYKRPNGAFSECYTVKNKDGTCITYAGSGTLEDKRFYIINEYSTFEQAINSAKSMAILEVSYKDYYNSFSYNENTQTYVDSGVIEVSDKYRSEQEGYIIDDTHTYYLVDNVVKFSNDKIVSYSSRINKYSCECRCVNQPDHTETGMECDISIEYFDIGATVVEVPPEIIAEAIENTYN